MVWLDLDHSDLASTYFKKGTTLESTANTKEDQCNTPYY
jgi:hypothetical protein